MVIPLYDAKTLFGNLDAIVASAVVFLADIENIDLSGRVRDRGLGDVCLRHVSKVRRIRMALTQLRLPTAHS
jgi:protein ECT2